MTTRSVGPRSVLATVAALGVAGALVVTFGGPAGHAVGLIAAMQEAPEPELGENGMVSSTYRPRTERVQPSGGTTGTPSGAPDVTDNSERPYFDQADWLWDPIPDGPQLDPQSEAMVGHLASGGDHIANTGDFGVTLRDTDDITEDTPRYPISFAQEGSWGPDPFEGQTVPIPEGTPIAPGSDGHLAIADPTTNMVYNMWVAEDAGDSWNAGWGAMTPLDGDGREENGSSTGAGIARYAAVVRAEEIAAGEIPHALFFSTNMAAPDEFRYPATKTDGSNMDGVGTPIPEGARVQLDPDLDLDSLGLNDGELTIARALQTYGAYVGDNGGARMAFLLEYAPESSAYSDAGLEGDYVPLDGIPWESLRVLSDWSGGQESGDVPSPDTVPSDGEISDSGGNQESPGGSNTHEGEGTEENRGDSEAGESGGDERGEDQRTPTVRTPVPTEEVDSDAAEPSGTSSGQILSVGSNGTYSSIQEAVDAAEPGDTVEVAGGTYNGFSVNTKGTSNGWITIQAEQGAEVVIEGGGGDQGLVDVNGAAYLRMIGLSVRGSDSHGIYGANTDHVVLSDCEVAGSSDGGIVILDSSDLLIEGCQVHGNNARGTSASNEAISVVNTDGFEIVGNDVYANGEEGIDAKYEARNGIIHGNRVEGNRGPNIYIDSAHDIEVYNNDVAGATEPSKSGIGLAVENYSETRRLANITIRDNRISDNAGAGIDFWTEGSGTMENVMVEGNEISGSGRGSITFNGGDFSGTNVIRDNQFSGGDEPPGDVPSGFTDDGGQVAGWWRPLYSLKWW